MTEFNHKAQRHTAQSIGGSSLKTAIEPSADPLKSQLGIGLDEIFEGFSFLRKEGGHFVFTDGEDELRFEFNSVKRALTQRLELDKNEALLEQLSQVGVFRVSFELPNLYSHEKSVQGAVVSINQEKTIAKVKLGGAESRDVHISLLRDIQAEGLIRELKELENSFFLLSIHYIAKRTKEVCAQLFHPANESTKINEATLTLNRIRRALVERLEENPKEIRSLSSTQLTDLQEELELGLANIGTGEYQLLAMFMKHLETLGERINLLNQSEQLLHLNGETVLELFDPMRIREELFEAMLDQKDMEPLYKSHALWCIGRAEERSHRRFDRSGVDHLDLSRFVEMIFRIQSQWINTQLRVGRYDLSLIRRFRALSIEEGMTLPILRDYEGITSDERLALYKELVEHRLNLMFSHQIVDQELRDHAHYNVNEFYRLFYKLTH